MPRWNPVSISGYHIREAGSTAAQELAFTLKNGLTYVEQPIARGLDVDSFAPRLSFFFNAHIDFFEEIAKYRAARRIWARELRESYGAQEPRSLAAALPHPDRRRVADRAAAGEQHRPHRDRGAGSRAGRHAVAAHQLLRRGPGAPDRGRRAGRASDAADHRDETGVANTTDPLGGSLLRRGADRSRSRGGLRATSPRSTSSADGRGVKPATRSARSPMRPSVPAGGRDRRRILVGVNDFVAGRRTSHTTLRIDPAVERTQIDRLAAPSSRRDAAVEGAGRAARGRRERTNLMQALFEATRVQATEGEIVHALQQVWGTYTETPASADAKG